MGKNMWFLFANLKHNVKKWDKEVDLVLKSTRRIRAQGFPMRLVRGEGARLKGHGLFLPQKAQKLFP